LGIGQYLPVLGSIAIGQYLAVFIPNTQGCMDKMPPDTRPKQHKHSSTLVYC